MSMRFIIFNILVLLLAHPVWANNLSVSNKTFFTDNNLDRIYFDSNGLFFQQLQDDFGEIISGQLIKGTWEFKDNKELCMDYTQPKLSVICFNITQNKNTRGYSAFDKNGKVHFVWKDYRDGDWLVTVDGMAYLKNIYAETQTDQNKDQEVIAYFSNKILDGFGGALSYFKENKSGIYQDRKTRELVPFTWDAKNGQIISFENGVTVEDQIFTLGKEFRNNISPKAVFYQKQSLFIVEGEEFTLENFENHPKQAIFNK